MLRVRCSRRRSVCRLQSLAHVQSASARRREAVAFVRARVQQGSLCGADGAMSRFVVAAHGPCQRAVCFDVDACGLVCTACGAAVPPRQMEHIFTLQCTLVSAIDNDDDGDDKHALVCTLRPSVACSLLGLSASEFERLSHAEKEQTCRTALSWTAKYAVSLTRVPSAPTRNDDADEMQLFTPLEKQPAHQYRIDAMALAR